MSFIGIEDIDFLLIRIISTKDLKSLASCSKYYYEKSNDNHLGCLLIHERFNIPYNAIKTLSNPKEALFKFDTAIIKDYDYRELILMKVAVEHNYMSIIISELKSTFIQNDDHIVFFGELFGASIRSFKLSEFHDQSLNTLSYLIEFVRDNMCDDFNLLLSRALKDFVGIDNEAMMMLVKEVRGTGISSHFDFYNGEPDPLTEATRISDTTVFTLLINNLTPIDYDFYVLLAELAYRGEKDLVIIMLDINFILGEKISAVARILEDDKHLNEIVAPMWYILKDYLEKHSF